MFTTIYVFQTSFFSYSPSFNHSSVQLLKEKACQTIRRAICMTCLALLAAANVAHSQVQGSLPAVISFLLDEENRCITAISTGSVVFDNLEPICDDEKIPVASRYFSFSHGGGALHIDYLSDFPNSFDTVLGLRNGNAIDGSLVASEANGTQDGQDDDGHADGFGSRLIYTDLAAGRYTIEAKAKNAVPNTAAFQLSVYGTKVTAKATKRLNDTGVEIAGILDDNSATCNGSDEYAEQDCSFGRDNNSIVGLAGTTNANNNDGHSAFSFLKVSASGAPLEEDASSWSCIKDNVTGLLWEVKTDDDALHDKEHTYSWYNDDPLSNGGSVGIRNGGTCSNAANCDTQGFRDAVNAAGLCGYNDWRLPTMAELHGLINYNTLSPAIDSVFYPNTVSDFYWSALPISGDIASARTVDFQYGAANFSNVDKVHAVRLVRSSN